MIIIKEKYPAVEPDALVDIVSVGVVVPLDAVQKGCRGDQQQDARKRTIVTIATRKERMKRVVVQLTDTSQKRDCLSSPE